jgi:hypothetical protein
VYQHDSKPLLCYFTVDAAGYQIVHVHCSSEAAQMAISGAKAGMSTLPRIAAQLPHLSGSSPVSYSMHLQFAAGTGGKKASEKRLATQCLGTVSQLARGMAEFVKVARGIELELGEIFAALACNSTQLAYLTRDMTAGVQQLSPGALQSLAATLKAQSGAAGGTCPAADIAQCGACMCAEYRDSS